MKVSAIAAAIMLTACGGDGGSTGGGSTGGGETGGGNAGGGTSGLTSISSIGQKDQPSAALASANLISLERQNCGVGGLSYDEDLAAVSVKHAAYIAHVRSKTPINNMNPHREQEYVNWEKDTGEGNPHFAGDSFIDRLLTAGYSKAPYFAGENIVLSSAATGNGMVKDPTVAAIGMTRSLLSAPYHLRTIMKPNRANAGTSLTTYTPYGKSANKSLGYILVAMDASKSNSVAEKLAGITTYPCESTSGTSTALYTESPDPTFGSGRDLRTDPIGQPIHILVDTADKIKVSNVKFRDTVRNTDVPVEMLDADKDPHKGTGYELPKNEAFILPITDGIKSCSGKQGAGKNNCGLMGNTSYEVSFDVLIDDGQFQSKKFTFKTGDVNYD